VALTSWVVAGSSTDLGTEPIAARWITEAAPGTAWSSIRSSRIDPSWRVTPSPSRFAGAPLDRSSTTTTSWPAATNSETDAGVIPTRYS
jgi:hypothetical protein